MNRQQLYDWINDPSRLDEESLATLQQLSEHFPYFPAARLLFLLNLKRLNDYRFDRELRRTSAFMPERAKLRYWIRAFDDEKATGRDLLPKSKPEAQTEDKTTAIHLQKLEEQIRESILEIEEKQSRLKELLDEKKSITVYGSHQGGDTQGRAHDQEPRPLPKDEFLEEFIRQKQLNPESRGSFYNPDEYARRSIEENENILSETLARLVAAQGKKDKAIKIYQQLMLKYPQKSSYFAAQIEKLRKEQ